MADHQDLVAEMAAVEKMATQDRLKHAKKRRTNQLKKWANYEKQLEKENSKRKKYGGNSKRKKNNDMPQGRTRRIRFPGKIVLLEAAARNDLEDVRRLLQQGVNPDSTNEDGLTALHQCCIDDSEDMLKLLLEFGANVNAQDSELWTPLHAAATCGHVHLCKHLIDKGANLLAVNADGNMPYDICEDEVTLDYIETEMARRGITQEEIDETRLIPEKNMLDDMKFIAQKKGNLEYLNDEGTTPLHIAAANGYLEVGKFLLDHHVSVDKRDYNGWQPIHAAACWLQPEFLELLVKNGADIDAKTRNGETPFDLCEDAEIKQKILDMKDEIENNKLINSRGSVKKHKHNTRSSTNSMYSSTTSLNDKSHSHGARHRSELHHSASIRRSSMRGEKNPLFMKEAKEEAMHFGWRKDDENDEDIVEDEKENNSIMQLDDVELIIDDDISRNKPAALKETSLNGDLEDLGSARPQKGFADTIELRHQKVAKTQSDSASSRSPKQGQRSSHTEVTQRPRSAAAPDAPRSLPLATEDNSGAPASTGIVKRSSFTRKSEMAAKKAEEERMLQQQQQKFPETLLEENSPTTPTEQDVRYPSGTPSATLSDLKKHRSEKRNSLENSTLDTQVQNLFLSSLNSNNKKYSSSSLPQRDQNASAPAAPNSNSHQGVKNKNGHNNNMESYNNNSQSLRRFVAPSSAPAVGGEEKDGCCVIL